MHHSLLQLIETCLHSIRNKEKLTLFEQFRIYMNGKHKIVYTFLFPNNVMKPFQIINICNFNILNLFANNSPLVHCDEFGVQPMVFIGADLKPSST